MHRPQVSGTMLSALNYDAVHAVDEARTIALLGTYPLL